MNSLLFIYVTEKEKSETLLLRSKNTNKMVSLADEYINQKPEAWGTHLVVVVHAGEVSPAFVTSNFNEALETTEHT